MDTLWPDFSPNLAVKENISAATQNQAWNALVFLYREILNFDLACI